MRLNSDDWHWVLQWTAVALFALIIFMLLVGACWDFVEQRVAPTSNGNILDAETQGIWLELMSHPKQPVFTISRNCDTRQWIVMATVVPHGQWRRATIWRSGNELAPILKAVLDELKAKL